MGKLSPLASVSETRAVLQAHGLATKKALGQNFLINDAILQKIVTLADVQPADTILEVGPGIGTLTIALLKHAGSVLSVERDTDLPAVLAETCALWADSFRVLNKDALALTEADVHAAMPELPRKLVSNLPYAVAATIVLDYFQRFSFLDSATIMVQKEVADRMMARKGTKNYGGYTVKLSLFAQAVDRFPVGPGNFFPPPRVESAVLRLDRCIVRDEQGQEIGRELLDATCIMADAAFASRRKTLANSCKTYFSGRGANGMDCGKDLPVLFERAGVDPSLRGEVLDRAQFIDLGRALLSLGN